MACSILLNVLSLSSFYPKSARSCPVGSIDSGSMRFEEIIETHFDNGLLPGAQVRERITVGTDKHQPHIL